MEISTLSPEDLGRIASIRQDPEVKDVVRDYKAGVKTVVIQDRYKIPPGRMYRILRAANVQSPWIVKLWVCS